MQRLKDYAQFLKDIREFFDSRDVTEVVTPYLSDYAISDVYIDSLETIVNKDIKQAEVKYLHTSPEIEMKKILLDGSDDIYQIAKVFRDNEEGDINFNEFTMLEWYRNRKNHKQLLEEVSEFITYILNIKNFKQLTFEQAFKQFANIENIYEKTLDELKIIAKDNKLSTEFIFLADIQMYLFVHFVEPQLAKLGAVFITNFPKEQAGLALVDNDFNISDINKIPIEVKSTQMEEYIQKHYPEFAYRFELYIDGMEIANGCRELYLKEDYLERFSQEIAKRKILNKSKIELDQGFLLKLENNELQNIYNTSGVAIGLDRLWRLRTTT